jgi:hypothetical protein
LHAELVGSVDAGEIPSRLKHLILRVSAHRPEFLQVAHIGGAHDDRRLHFEEARAKQALHNQRQDQPAADENAEDEKRAGLIEAELGHVGGDSEPRWHARQAPRREL